MKEYGREQFGDIAGQYLSPYVYGKKFLDTPYGIRKDDGAFKIGDSTLTVGRYSDVWFKGKRFRGTPVLVELLTRKNVKHEIITSTDLRTCKKILTMTNVHLEGYEPGGVIRIERGPKFHDIIATLFAHTKRRGMEPALARRWAKF